MILKKGVLTAERAPITMEPNHVHEEHVHVYLKCTYLMENTEYILMYIVLKHMFGRSKHHHKCSVRLGNKQNPANRLQQQNCVKFNGQKVSAVPQWESRIVTHKGHPTLL